MTAEEKKEIATFRFGVIHDLVNRTDLAHGEQERLLRAKSHQRWNIPHSNRTRLGRSTILRWLRRYETSNGKIESLYPPDRGDRGKSRVLDEETIMTLLRLREEFPRLTINALIAKMEERHLVGGGMRLTGSTVYRLLRQHGLIKPELGEVEDRRKFEAELPNDIWQSDVLHGPMVKVGDKLRKSYLVAVLDDHSRLVAHGEFYLSERLESYLDAFQKALLKRGLPRKLYVDNGAAFRSRHLEYTCASLGIALIHSRPYKPQGRGKIERLFRTVREEVLSGFEGGSLEQLNTVFAKWLQETYHQRKHHATGQSPFARFTARMQCLRTAPPNLSDHFRKTARRRVAKDRTLILNGLLYEAPLSLIGKAVELLYHEPQDGPVEIVCQGTSYGFVNPVDLHVNCRVKRERERTTLSDSGRSSRYQGGGLWSGRGEERP